MGVVCCGYRSASGGAVVRGELTMATRGTANVGTWGGTRRRTALGRIPR